MLNDAEIYLSQTIYWPYIKGNQTIEAYNGG